MGDDFVLHERLAADTAALADWPLCRVLLMNDQSWPWLILVPRRPDLKEIHDLDRDARAQLTEEICRASRALQTSFAPDQINVGALGNLVPQLHVHVIARFTTDPAWPGRSEEHTSEPQSLMRIPHAVLCLKQKQLL